MISLADKEKLEPGRTVFVLLHEDQTHCFASHPECVDWGYDDVRLKLLQQIMKKDFGTCKYHITTLDDAIVRISNTQAELVKAWTPYINRIRKTGDVEKRRRIYSEARHKLKAAHPIEADQMLRRLLNW